MLLDAVYWWPRVSSVVVVDYIFTRTITSNRNEPKEQTKENLMRVINKSIFSVVGGWTSPDPQLCYNNY